jgi:hypothetical protein
MAEENRAKAQDSPEMASPTESIDGVRFSVGTMASDVLSDSPDEHVRLMFRTTWCVRARAVA